MGEVYLMLSAKGINDVGQKLLNIVNDLHWIGFNNAKTGHTFSIMAVKSIILQLKDVEKFLEELIQEEEV